MSYYDALGNYVEDGQQSVYQPPAPPPVMAPAPPQPQYTMPQPAYSADAFSQVPQQPVAPQTPAPPLPAQQLPGYVPNPNVGTEFNPRAAAAATQATQPQPKGPPLLIRTGGSPGGLTKVGKVAQTAIPASIKAEEAAADAQARGLEAEGLGYDRAAGAVMAGLGREADMQAEDKAIARHKDDAKVAYLQRRGEIAEEEKNDTIDPSRIFTGDNGTASRVLSIVGMALGGFLQGSRGGPNPFEHTLNGIIENDIAQQQQALKAKSKSRETQLGTLAGEIDRWGDQQAAQEKLRGDMWNNVARQSDMYAKVATNEKMRANAEAMRDMALANAMKANVQFAEFMSSRAAYRPGSGGGVRANPAVLANLSPDQLIAYNEQKAQLKKAGASESEAAAGAFRGITGETLAMREEARKREGARADREAADRPKQGALYVAGAAGNARSPEDASKLRLLGENASIVVNNLDEIQRLRDESVTNRLSPAAQKRLNALVSANTTALSVLFGLGAISKDDRAIVGPLTGEGALDLWSPGMDAGLKQAREIIRAREKAAYDQYGVTPATETAQGGSIQNRTTGTASAARNFDFKER